MRAAATTPEAEALKRDVQDGMSNLRDELDLALVQRYRAALEDLRTAAGDPDSLDGRGGPPEETQQRVGQGDRAHATLPQLHGEGSPVPIDLQADAAGRSKGIALGVVQGETQTGLDLVGSLRKGQRDVGPGRGHGERRSPPITWPQV